MSSHKKLRRNLALVCWAGCAAISLHALSPWSGALLFGTLAGAAGAVYIVVGTGITGRDGPARLVAWSTCVVLWLVTAWAARQEMAQVLFGDAAGP